MQTQATAKRSPISQVRSHSSAPQSAPRLTHAPPRTHAPGLKKFRWNDQLRLLVWRIVQADTEAQRLRHEQQIA
jgi:hypothetical protein